MASDDATPAPLDALAACSIDRWYPVLRRNSVRTTLVPLGDEFLAYLQADGVFVAGGDDDDDGWGDDDADGAAPPPRFPELEAAIEAAVGDYGAVFPKLNWSSPRDASWILGGSCKCTSARDVLLLLKSSDSVAHDRRAMEARITMMVNRKAEKAHNESERKAERCLLYTSPSPRD